MATPSNGDRFLPVQSADGRVAPFKLTPATQLGQRFIPIKTPDGRLGALRVQVVTTQGSQGIPSVSADALLALVKEAGGFKLSAFGYNAHASLGCMHNQWGFSSFHYIYSSNTARILALPSEWLDTDYINPTEQPIPEDFVWAYASQYSSFAIRANGELWGWGHVEYLGISAEPYWFQAWRYPKLDDAGPWVMASNNSYGSAYGLKSGGTIWARGRNNYGQLGQGDTTDRWGAWTQIGSASNWVKISGGGGSGQGHGAAINADGELWTWGINTYGQLGQGDTTQRTSPTQVGSGTDWVDVCCGAEYTLARKTDGTIWATGRNNYGQLGQGDTTQRTSFTQIGSATDWVAISAYYSTYVINASGELYACGYNYYGQLGLGDKTNRTSLTLVGSGFASVSSKGNSNAGALKVDGSIWVAGLQSFDGLGKADICTDQTSFVQIASGYSQLSYGALHGVCIGDTPDAFPYVLWMRVMIFNCSGWDSESNLAIYGGPTDHADFLYQSSGVSYYDLPNFFQPSVESKKVEVTVSGQQSANAMLTAESEYSQNGMRINGMIFNSALPTDDEGKPIGPALAAICRDIARMVLDIQEYGNRLYADDGTWKDPESLGNGWWNIGHPTDSQGSTLFVKLYPIAIPLCLAGLIRARRESQFIPTQADYDFKSDFPFGGYGGTPDLPTTTQVKTWCVEKWQASYAAFGDCVGGWSGGWGSDGCVETYFTSVEPSDLDAWIEDSCDHYDYCDDPYFPYEECYATAFYYRATLVDEYPCGDCECGSDPGTPSGAPSCCG